MNRTIGYLLPEFPGQTHIFWWREMNALTRMGIDIDIVSTRRPLSKLMSHTWVQEAQQRTTYLFPPRPNLFGILIELLRCGIPGWFRCLQAILNAKNASLSGRLRLLALAFVGAEVSNLARSRNWQHLHVHSCADAANIAMFAALISKLSYSLTLHGPLKDYGPNQEQKWQHAAFGIVITQQLYEEVQNSLVGYLPKTIKIAPMGVDLDVFTRTSSYSPWRRNGACRIFSCGRLNFCKGYVDLIAAVDILRKQGINAELKIAGEDEQGGNGYRKELETLIQTLGLTDSVSLLGAVSEDRVKACLEEAHIFALASLREPLGVAIMEAMAMELPIVVTGSGGVKELVEAEVNGLLVEPQAPTQLADAISQLLHNPELSIRLGQAAREKIIQQFQAKRSAKVLYDAITELYPTTVETLSGKL
ncbi:exopolysaccharide biosynthesis GT4 family glycosyltransferase EpsE [Coleofasciculus sp.]|uniref:exopolysaccharide biosynthesis GT4 family glycosyltransferase EpsE n=1 Tax=Coleofasciculus sp. TaxID=3100458 RepID=UPI00406426A7